MPQYFNSSDFKLYFTDHREACHMNFDNISKKTQLDYRGPRAVNDRRRGLKRTHKTFWCLLGT